MYVHESAYICAKALFPPHSVNTVPLAPPQSGTEPLFTWVIAAQHSPVHPTTKPLKPLCQFLSAWENYSENLKLVTRRDRAWVRPSIQMQTTLFQRRGAVSNIASKCPGPETRAMQPARKGAIERIPASELESSFYSRYFVVAKRDGGLRSILDLRPINRALCKHPFRMISLEQILAQIRPGDWLRPWI